MPGKNPGPSILNARQYERLKAMGYSKSSAAAISNASYDKGAAKHTPAAKKARKNYKKTFKRR